MKVSLFLSKLKHLINADELLLAASKGGDLHELLAYLETNKKIDLAEALLPIIQNSSGAKSSESTSKSYGALAKYSPFVKSACTKTFENDFNLVTRLLQSVDDMNLKDIIRNVRNGYSHVTNENVGGAEDIIGKYETLLKSSLEDSNSFETAFSALKSDKRMTKENVIKLASRVAFRMPSDITKAKALEKIYDQHRYIIGGMKASKSSSGKTAA